MSSQFADLPPRLPNWRPFYLSRLEFRPRVSKMCITNARQGITFARRCNNVVGSRINSVGNRNTQKAVNLSDTIDRLPADQNQQYKKKVLIDLALNPTDITNQVKGSFDCQRAKNAGGTLVPLSDMIISYLSRHSISGTKRP